jgi:hypothetical protein
VLVGFIDNTLDDNAHALLFLNRLLEELEHRLVAAGVENVVGEKLKELGLALWSCPLLLLPVFFGLEFLDILLVPHSGIVFEAVDDLVEISVEHSELKDNFVQSEEVNENGADLLVEG